MEHPIPTPGQIAEAISCRMTTTGVSLREASRATNIPLTTLSRRLNGSPFLSTELSALAAVLDVTVSQLVVEAERIAASTDSGAA